MSRPQVGAARGQGWPAFLSSRFLCRRWLGGSAALATPLESSLGPGGSCCQQVDLPRGPGPPVGGGASFLHRHAPSPQQGSQPSTQEPAATQGQLPVSVPEGLHPCCVHRKGPPSSYV